MKFIYSADVHGDINKYEKLLNIAQSENIKYIVIGGDILPKHNNRFIEQPRFISDYFKDYFTRLKELDINIVLILGNDDIIILDEYFDDFCNEFDNVYNIPSKKVEFEGYEFIGMNYILDHPFRCKDRVVIEDNYKFQEQYGSALISSKNVYDNIPNWKEYAKDNLNKMKSILEDLPKPKDINKTIYVMHMPPANLGLDIVAHNLLPVGSQEVYNFIRNQQPLLTLHGHIHEGPDVLGGTWKNNLNNTVCIQPGQTEYKHNNLVFCYIDLDNKEFRRFVIYLSEQEA